MDVLYSSGKNGRSGGFAHCGRFQGICAVLRVLEAKVSEVRKVLEVFEVAEALEVQVAERVPLPI